ncbi:MAG: hypothetical protein KatS3mg031_0040 [Chitinophagales bacterium]|nr:MAG: hypothetical protein KatS3mg031_0040 [Chitinophagales bacterium]
MVSIVFFGILAELSARFVLYIRGEQTGRLDPAWWNLRLVDTLRVHNIFFTDAEGIFRTSADRWDESGITINAAGFRGREFRRFPEDSFSRSILFIGDSFTWGLNARPIDQCFVDRIGRESSFICFNAGIPGADPAQYALIASRYVPVLKPDYTVVTVYLANDLMDVPRKIIPGLPLYFQTNAGWLPSFFRGRYFLTAEESYAFARQQFIPEQTWKKLLLKTGIGTALLSVSMKISEYRDWERRTRSSVTNQYLQSIREVCAREGSRLFIFIVPPRQTDVNSSFTHNPDGYIKKKYPALTKGLEEYIHVIPVRKEHYDSAVDGHFNNDGHRIAAGFILLRLLDN